MSVRPGKSLIHWLALCAILVALPLVPSAHQHVRPADQVAHNLFLGTGVALQDICSDRVDGLAERCDACRLAASVQVVAPFCVQPRTLSLRARPSVVQTAQHPPRAPSPGWLSRAPPA
ncbi:MAG: hypothetical protein AAGB10_05240 [Pseudomonadota bacterium]